MHMPRRCVWPALSRCAGPARVACSYSASLLPCCLSSLGPGGRCAIRAGINSRDRTPSLLKQTTHCFSLLQQAWNPSRGLKPAACLRRHALDPLERLGLGILHGLRRVLVLLQDFGQLGADDVVELHVVRRAVDRRDIIGDLGPDLIGLLAAKEV